MSNWRGKVVLGAIGALVAAVFILTAYTLVFFLGLSP